MSRILATAFILASLSLAAICNLDIERTIELSFQTKKLMRISNNRYALWDETNRVHILNQDLVQIDPRSTFNIFDANADVSVFAVSDDGKTIAGAEEKEFCWHNFE